MIKLLPSFILIFILSGSTYLQAQDWERQKQDPTATELWEPVPPKVTPGQGMAPPSDAVVLFDGSDFSAWEASNGEEITWKLDQAEACMTVAGRGGIKTKQKFGSMQLHLEFRTPAKLEGKGQGRGNSGVFLMGRYEIQVLDSYSSETYANGQAGSIYKQYPPLVNATRPPGEWQSYDIIFTAPVFGEGGRMVRPAVVTAFHNGVLIQNNVALLGPSEYKGQAIYKPHADQLPLSLQEHGNPVSYRNIWIREL
ncbi:MAG: DUF1080 domain-containing protein [Bacteroidota bacterium]